MPLTLAELKEMKAQVEKENAHEESTKPSSVEDHPATVEATTDPCNPEPENPPPPEAAKTKEPEDNTKDYEQKRKNTCSYLKTPYHSL